MNGPLATRRRAGEFAADYEALRARAVSAGRGPAPRGFAFLLARGLCDWMQAASDTALAPQAPATAADSEIVRVLAAIARAHAPNQESIP